MEKSTIFNRKIHYKWPFSIAMLVYQRVRWTTRYHNSNMLYTPVVKKMTIRIYTCFEDLSIHNGDIPLPCCVSKGPHLAHVHPIVYKIIFPVWAMIKKTGWSLSGGMLSDKYWELSQIVHFYYIIPITFSKIYIIYPIYYPINVYIYTYIFIYLYHGSYIIPCVNR